MLTVASPQFSEAVVVMGVASCGKTTLGEALAARLQIAFTEGDKLHSPANIAKMSAGIPLTDDDRWPWLERVGLSLAGPLGHVTSCSALKKAYRQAIVMAAGRAVRFVHLHGSRMVLQQRIASRSGHFMPASLLDSQLATLEMPDSSEDAIAIDIDQTAQGILDAAVEFLTAGRRNA